MLLSQQIMNKLIDLKEWQQKQEELLRIRQQKQIALLSEQKYKLIALTNSVQNSDVNKTDECLLTNDQNIDICLNNDNNERKSVQLNEESIEEIRAEEHENELINNTSIDAENGFVNQSFSRSYLESSPVVPGIDGKRVKTFEELLNIKISDDKNASKENSTKALTEINENKPKKPFLRKGEGIKRFEGTKRTESKKSCLNDNNNNKKSICFEVLKTPNSVKEKISPKINSKTSLNNFKTKNIENVHKLSSNVSKLNENKHLKSERKNTKQFNRKVIPLTTKIVPNKTKNKEIIISRNTPINNKISDDESALFDYLEYVCGNISLDDNSSVIREHPKTKSKSSFKDKLNDKDVDELQSLLKKIELKKDGIQRKLDENNCWTDVSDDENKSNNCKKLVKKVHHKKKVRWSPNVSPKSIKTNEFSDDEDLDLKEPKFGAYSSLLKQQITQLENRMSDLKLQSVKKEKVVSNDSKSCLNQSANNNVLSPISDEVTKLKATIETLSKRLINIESKSYDLISSQTNEFLKRKQNIKSKSNYFECNPMKSNSSPNGHNISVKQNQNDTTVDFPNGDKMKISKDNTVYYSFTNGATQTTYADGLRIINFPNGQIEKLHKNGVKHITYNNGLQRIINPDSSEEVLLGDGTIWRIHSDGTESLEFSNGDREIRTEEYKRREYKNGNMKTLYSDGTEETRYVSGRLRIKDRFGNLIVDSVMKNLNEHTF